LVPTATRRVWRDVPIGVIVGVVAMMATHDISGLLVIWWMF
jgi:hypothetical protein